jgi:hypothetical protein
MRRDAVKDPVHPESERCACRKLRPRRSGCSVVLMDDASEAVASAYVQPGDLSRIADRFGYRMERGCLIHGLVGAVPVVVFFELPERPQRVTLVPDQGAIEEFAAQFLHPALHDGVHEGCANASEDGRDAGVGEDLAEPGGELGVPVPDQVRNHRAGVFEVDDQVPGELSDPVRGGVGGGAEDADAASRVLDDSKDVLALTGQRHGLDEVAGQKRVSLGTQEGGPAAGAPVGCGVDALGLEDLPHALIPRAASSPWMRR